MPINKQNLAYWITTGLVALAMGAGGVMDLLASDEILAVLRNLGYPDYLATILGVAKVAGVIALLAPVPTWIREWAYAGFVFDLVGASASHAFSGDPIGDTVTPLVILIPVAASYYLWKRRLAA